MPAALAALLLCQLAGEALVRLTGVPVPGPVLGMVLLAAILIARLPVPERLGATAGGILQHLSLLFVPAGVGVVQHVGLIAGEGLRIFVVIVISTVIALAVTAVVFAALARALAVEAGEPRPQREDGGR